MQLKRDTDYAMRIIMRLAQQDAIPGKLTAPVSLLEICRETGVPRTSAARICNRMVDAGMLQSATSGSPTTQAYISLCDPNAITAKDVICLTEGRLDLFAVFDKNTELYRRFGEVFDDAARRIDEALSDVTVGDILKKQ